VARLQAQLLDPLKVRHPKWVLQLSSVLPDRVAEFVDAQVLVRIATR
jgi:hypothetical protein